MKTSDDVIYLGDNGRALCGAHLGVTAKTTGRDLSGQPIMAITPAVIAEEPDAAHIACEHCGALPGDTELFAAQIAKVQTMTLTELAALIVPAPRRKVRARVVG